MKNLNQFFEGLLDSDFDVPKFEVDPIQAVTPVGDDDGDWQKTVDKVNASLEPFKFYTRINQLIDDARQLHTDMKDVKFVARTKMHNFSNWLFEGTKLTKLDIEQDIDEERVKIVRLLNDIFAAVNKNAEFKKLVSALGGYFYCSIGERSIPRLGTTYAGATWNLTSPNDDVTSKLEKIADKFNKINRDVVFEMGKNSLGDGIFSMRLIKLPK